MALLKYLRPDPSHRIVDPHGPLSAIVPSSVLNEVDKELKSSTTEKKKRGPYLSFTPEEKPKWQSTRVAMEFVPLFDATTRKAERS